MLDKKYNFKEVEEGKYVFWVKSHAFESGDKSKEPFCIVIPPPNVTGNLHLGHALNGSIQDVIIRYKHMKGFDTLWLPGMDHAAISTEAKVVNKLKSEGISKHDIGREEFLSECWKWTNEHRSNIHKQWAMLGLSVDYTKERFTLDEGLNEAVTEVFINLYNEGLIYKGEKIINWDPVAKTALSNEEVIYKNDEGAFYHIKYYIEGKDDYLDIATTRPETLFGDTAVAVNPSDKRYKHLIGKNVMLPIVNKLIPIIGDVHADPEFGSGCVKITPAHDPNDFEVGERHNLERIVIMNSDATMNENALKYKGMTREECRCELLKDLEKDNLLISIEKMVHSVGHSERTDAVVEPYLSKQWFVKMDKMAKDLLNMQKNSDEKINFFPKRFEKILNHWMEDCHDWCISRQLYWGHRIPAWYKEDEIFVGHNKPEGEGWIQDNDVLDTWFSSALWPFSTLGWPNKTEDLERYFPTNTLVTAYDIIFFWVARMAFSSLKQMKTRPFKDCIIHGLIRDKDGRKMSKSLGNGIDPIDMINTYGTDALRYYLTTTSAMGSDIRFDTDKVASTWNFINKMWNASRFVLMKLVGYKETNINVNELNNADKWILTRLNETIKKVTKYMEKYEFNNAGAILYSFIWNDFCDNYIEMSKFSTSNATLSTLLYTLTCILKMMHPFMPFVTEEIYNNIKSEESLLFNTGYPEYNKKYIFKNETKSIDEMLEYITLFRNKKADNKLTSEFEVIDYNNNELLNKMLKLTDKIIKTSKYKDKLTIELYNYKFDIYFDNSKNSEEEIKKINEEIDTLTSSIERRKKLLSNENYVSKAPEKIVSKEREDLEKEINRLEIIKNIINEF